MLQQEHGPGDHEESAVKRVAAKMIRQSSAIGGRIIGKENSNLSAEEKERRRKERLERDAWCRRERKYRDSSPDGRGEPTEWLEGDKVRESDPYVSLVCAPLISPRLSGRHRVSRRSYGCPRSHRGRATSIGKEAPRRSPFAGSLLGSDGSRILSSGSPDIERQPPQSPTRSEGTESRRSGETCRFASPSPLYRIARTTGRHCRRGGSRRVLFSGL